MSDIYGKIRESEGKEEIEEKWNKICANRLAEYKVLNECLAPVVTISLFAVDRSYICMHIHKCKIYTI